MTLPSLHGRIQGDSLPQTMQMLHTMQRTCTVLIHAHGEVGRLAYLGGKLIHAAFRRAEGEAALPGLLTLTDGNFEVYDGPPPPERTIHRSHDHVLMSAAVALDEAAAPRGGSDELLIADDLLITDGPPPSAEGPAAPLPPTTTVPVLRINLADSGLDGESLAALSAVDGTRNVLEIAALSGIPLLPLRVLLDEHRLQGHLAYEPPLMPPAFWRDTHAAVTQVVGPASIRLMQAAARTLGLTPGRVPVAQAQLLHDALGQLIRPEKQAAFRSQVQAVQTAYGVGQPGPPWQVQF